MASKGQQASKGERSKVQRVGYVRVSSLDQNEQRQLEGVELDRTFTDKASGKDTNRPQLQAMLTFVREGDTVVVHSMDRLARSLDDLRRMVQEMNTRGVVVEFVKEHLTFTGEDSPIANLMLSIMGAVAEFERALIGERQREGITIAKREGKFTGGKRRVSDEQVEKMRERLASGMTRAAIAREFKLSRETVYVYLPAEKKP